MRLRGVIRKLGQRWLWRASRSRAARVTVVNQFFPPDYAATGQLLEDLTTRLAASGLQVQVLTGMPAYANEQAPAERIEFRPDVCIRRTRASRFWPRRIRGRAVNGLVFCLRTFLRLLRYARRGDLLLYTTEPPYLPVLAWLLHSLTHTPYLLVVYDLYPDVPIELGVLPPHHPLWRLWRRLNRLAFAAAAEVVVLSPAMAERVAAAAPAALHHLHVIPSWADPERIRPLPKRANPFARRHRLLDRFVVLYSGNQGRCHDLRTLLDTARLLRDRPEVSFLIIGGGPQNENLRRLAGEWELANVCFLPYQPLAELPHSLAAADLAVVSLGVGAFGIVAPSKLYGHLAAATPIAAITPPHSHLQELVEMHRCGRWFANGDGAGLAAWILALKADPARARSLGRAARELLLDTATPELVTARYGELIHRHLPADKRQLAAASPHVTVDAPAGTRHLSPAA
jgi:glycosyltransferase involved in cell wall biosynthesis